MEGLDTTNIKLIDVLVMVRLTEPTTISDLDLTTYCRNAEGGMFNYFQNNNLIEKFHEFRHLSANYEFKS